MNDDLIYLNGIDGVTGNYLVPPLPAAEAAELARGQRPDGGTASWLKRLWAVLRRPFLGLPFAFSGSFSEYTFGPAVGAAMLALYLVAASVVRHSSLNCLPCPRRSKRSATAGEMKRVSGA